MRSTAKLVAAVGFLVTACDGGGDGGGDGSGQPGPVGGPDTAVEEPAPIPPEPETPALTYPPGPYGHEYLDIIQDHGFYDPWVGDEVRFSDFLGAEDAKVLIVTSAAGWCSACQYEAWDLVDVYEQYRGYGLEVLYTFYEDTKGKALWQKDASLEELDKDFTFLTDWKGSVGDWIGLEPRVANYPVLVDVDFALGAYYDKAATPLTLVIRTSDMRILYRQIGYAGRNIESIVKGVLFE